MTEKEENIPAEKPSFKGQLGGARPGSGRPKGSMNDDTRLLMEAKKAFKLRAMEHAQELLQAQLSLAVGYQMLFYTPTDENGKKGKPVQVTNPDEIREFIDSGSKQDGYFITVKAPDNNAIQALLDRTFGKSEQQIDITTEGESINPGKEILAGVIGLLNTKTLEEANDTDTDANGDADTTTA